MTLIVSAFICGVIFGSGLVISGMTQPAKVLGFLDVFGTWDPTLLVVMAAALAVSAPGFALARRRTRPIIAEKAHWPTRAEVDRRLVAGAVLFGAGWGLVGLCPGPAIVNLATLSPRIVVFAVAMALGMVLYDIAQLRGEAQPSPA